MSAPAHRTEIVAVLPTLDEVAANPQLVEHLSPHAAKALLLRGTIAQSALWTRLLDDETTPTLAPEADEMLTPIQAAELLKQSKRWLSRHARQLPFVKRISQRRFVCSRNGIVKWLGARRA